MGSELGRRPTITGALEQSRLNRDVSSALAISDGRAKVAKTDIGNAYEVLEYTAFRHAQYSALVSWLSHDNPKLELGLRKYQDVVELAVGMRLYRYLDE